MEMTKYLKNEKGFAFIEYTVVFVLIFPFVILMPDFITWGTNLIKANAIINETIQFIGEHGGANETTVAYLEKRFTESGLDPAQWDLTISGGQRMKGEALSLAVESTYTFNSIKMLGINFTLPMKASASAPSQLFMR
ncbi:hypothetical protein QO009_003056 [Brevibacillus aydinogluensis]|jgi:hypothetical protein|uniref:hypothetical protein n=1 Tax=Brevibacillus aydinogluensis TaxID=927786 RepID=UPI002892A208|nr:hypothetical protein [Brevibacillus aydinogluensis]MDT3417161.1 hypothetical protein [Brevibacillus aydinogluensis]